MVAFAKIQYPGGIKSAIAGHTNSSVALSGRTLAKQPVVVERQFLESDWFLF